MLLILPPSESKRAGGEEGTRLDPGLLSFSALTPIRERVLAALGEFGGDLDAMGAALKVGARQRDELERNTEVASSPVMPSLDRFTGVLFDGLGAETLTAAEREFAGATVAVHSALFGLVGALDPIPAYRLSHDSKLPGLSLKKIWAAPISAVLAERSGLILDLRSEAYSALGPAPSRPDSLYLRVVADDGTGRTRALNHFNKKGKGEFTRAIIEAGIEHPNAASLLEWAADSGYALVPGKPGELELVVRNAVGAQLV
ncbi:YaaA family protein [Salinibacterium hongtaonis]|uniref:Peroxide stress protein YaaA n=1 Tax=Homoserinimonas hongtaonis TaxID=2079791 RepID=A0A2U1SX65_9MICO|nr:peroxide stress protein YaaA [Salinibacterium hongtaonis]PWB96231.1 peroxide stress protein YaaA [Salinibacterium hongtaonis]